MSGCNKSFLSSTRGSWVIWLFNLGFLILSRAWHMLAKRMSLMTTNINICLAHFKCVDWAFRAANALIGGSDLTNSIPSFTLSAHNFRWKHFVDPCGVLIMLIYNNLNESQYHSYNGHPSICDNLKVFLEIFSTLLKLICIAL